MVQRRTAVCLAIFLAFVFASAVFAEAVDGSPGDQTRGHRSVRHGVPHLALAGSGITGILKPLGLTIFVSRQAQQFNLIDDDRWRNDFRRILGGGLEFAAAEGWTLLLEFRYSVGLVNLAKAGLPALAWTRFRSQAMSLQAGIRILLGADVP